MSSWGFLSQGRVGAGLPGPPAPRIVGLSNCSHSGGYRPMPGAATRVRTPSMPARRSARKQPAQQRSRATVDVILQATARVLGRHGYAGTNTNLIAQTAGVSV